MDRRTALRGARDWRVLGLAVFAFVALATISLMSLSSPVQAAAQGSAGLTINDGDPVTVGETYAYRMTVINSSTSPEDVDDIQLTSIIAYPACDSFFDVTATSLCSTAANQNAGTFTPGAVGTGSAGTACEGDTFTVTEDATGQWTFTPLSPATYPLLGPSSPGGGLATCEITGAVEVDALPSDADAGTTGIQTNQLARSEGATAGPEHVGRPFTATGSSQITVIAPDIKVEKTPDAGSVTAGADAVFTIVVTNLGPGTAMGVTLDDTLPATTGAWVLGGADAADCMLVGDELDCDFGDLDELATRTITLTSPTVAADCGELPNSVTVSSTNEDPLLLSNNTDTANITVVCLPDIKVEKTPDAGSIMAGADAVFTIVVTNLGPGTAEGVTLDDTLPATTGAWVLGGPDAGDCMLTGDVLDCDFGDLAEDATRTITLTSPTVAADCGELPNSVTVSSTNEDPLLLSNNTDTANITVVCLPDIKVEKTPDAGSISAGADAVFTIVVTNLGPGTAEGVTLDDTLPATTGAWVLGGPDAGDCMLTGDVLDCDFGDLAEDATRTITLTSPTVAADCGELPNSVTVSSTNEDPLLLSNNTDTANITVVCALEGCTPGFWSANAVNKNAVAWGPTGYLPSQTVGSVFTGATASLSSATLLEALKFNGGGGVIGAERILLRAAVAGLLNSAHPDIDYPESTADLIAAVNAALASDDRAAILALASSIDADNNLGCTINQQGEPE